jgi:hypothetical protein
MGLKNILGSQRGLEVVFRLKLDVLQGIVADNRFHKDHKDIVDIKSLVSDLSEIVKEYEIQTVKEHL